MYTLHVQSCASVPTNGYDSYMPGHANCLLCTRVCKQWTVSYTHMYSGKLEYACGMQTENDPVDVQFRYGDESMYQLRMILCIDLLVNDVMQ